MNGGLLCGEIGDARQKTLISGLTLHLTGGCILCSIEGIGRKAVLKIGELAKRLGLNVRTIRYYESISLLAKPARTEGGYRLYSEADAEKLRFILQAKWCIR